MATRQEIVAAARSWIGTPFEHQGRMKAVGVDCAGLVLGVARELGLPHADVDGYPRIPSRGQLEAELAAQMERLAIGEPPQPGDVLLLRIEREPQHLAILTSLEPMAAVHALAGKGLSRCVEHRLDERWQSRLIAAYRFRGLEA